MPVVQKNIPTQKGEFWDLIDPNNMRQVLKTVKEEVTVNKSSGSPCKT